MPMLSTSSADQPEDAPAPAEATPPAPVAPAPGQATAAPEAASAADSGGAPTPEAGSLERMARLRRRVREDGVEPETAARELGVDPIIAQLWLRLPDDLWPSARPGAPRPPGDAASPPTSPL